MSVEKIYFYPPGKPPQLIAFRVIDPQYPAESVFIDWLNFTFGEEHYPGSESSSSILADPTPLLTWVSQELTQLLGFGLTTSCQRGSEGYTNSWVLGNHWGFVAQGGYSQKQTVLVKLNGQGCMAAHEGWESRVYHWLTSLQAQGRAKITRIHLAFDDYEGQYLTPEQVREECQKGQDSAFNNGRQTPYTSLAGVWDFPEQGKGKTCYVGSSKSGKRCRVYEKGKELGDPNSPWIRTELDLVARKDRPLPLDMLIRPGEYLAGAYVRSDRPGQGALEWLLGSKVTHSPTRLKTALKIAERSLENSVHHARRMHGSLINALVQLNYSSREIVELLRTSRLPDWFGEQPIFQRLPPLNSN